MDQTLGADAREVGCPRRPRESTDVKGGGLWVVPEFGLDQTTGKFTEGYARNGVDGFSLPDNKQNIIALWLLAMGDVAKTPAYTQHRRKMVAHDEVAHEDSRGGGREVLRVELLGPGRRVDEKKPDGSLKHWVGVHPNGGYYGVDLEGIVAVYEHGLVFTKDDIDRLIATNRDFMWNKQVKGAKFQRIDGGEPDTRWKTTQGVLLGGPDALRRDLAQGLRGQSRSLGLGRPERDARVRRTFGERLSSIVGAASFPRAINSLYDSQL